MAEAVRLSGIRKTFGPKVAVEGMELSIPEGSLCGFIGPNGAGKTTTIRMIMSIIFPDSGELSVLGKSSAVESKDRIGYLPEERGLYKKMKVGAFLKYVARLKGIDGAGLDRKVADWLSRVGLADVARKKCEELSKGMQQKVQFVASIIHEPDLIILDEPFSGLDPVNSRLLRELIDEQHRSGRTIIFSTHQMLQAEALCDRVVMIHQGKKVLDDSPAAIRSKFDPRTVAVEPVESPSDADLVPYRSITGVKLVERRGKLLDLHALPNGDIGAIMSQACTLRPVNKVEVVRPSLEDIFIDIVQQSLPPAEREKLIATLRSPLATLAGSLEGGGD
ncbi:MAG: ABC transporter ATP-binding protein [Phycisphaerales bacterium]